MQQCQDHLEFAIETPSDKELDRRYGLAERQAKAFAQQQAESTVKQGATRKHKKRLQKSAKKLARLNR